MTNTRRCTGRLMGAEGHPAHTRTHAHARPRAHTPAPEPSVAVNTFHISLLPKVTSWNLFNCC